MQLEEKLARALAAAFILGRNNSFSTVDELWESWLPEVSRVLEGVTYVDGFDAAMRSLASSEQSFGYSQSGVHIVLPQFINSEPIKLNPEIPQ